MTFSWIAFLAGAAFGMLVILFILFGWMLFEARPWKR